MTEQLSPRRVSLSLAIVSGIVSIICALLIAIAPEGSVKLFGAIFHGIDVSKITATMTLGSAALGTVEVIIIALVVGWLYAKIYNSLKA